MKFEFWKWSLGLSLSLAFVGLQAAELEEGPLVGGLKDLKKLDQKLIAMSERCSKATVALVSKGGGGTGSGVIVSKDGLILTAAHVVEAMKGELVVIFPDGTRKAGEILGGEFDRDAAMARITEEGDYPFVDLAKGDALQRNQWCVALGHPGGFDPSRTPPVRLGRVLTVGDFVETDCAVVGGDSGGPLFDVEGRLIGIHSNIGMTLSQNRHVPLAVFREHWDMMKEGKRQGRKFAAKVDGDPDRPVMGVQLGEPGPKGGVRVTGVMERSPAAKAGLKAGDIIVAVAGNRVKGRDSLIEITGKLETGKKLNLMYVRDGKRRRTELQLIRMSDLMGGSPERKEDKPKRVDRSGQEDRKKPKAAQSEDALDRYLDEMLEGGSGKLELTEEQLKEFGGMEKLMKRIKERSGLGEEEKDADAKEEKTDEEGPKDAKIDLEEMLKDSMENGGRLELTPAQLEEFGGPAKLAETIRNMMKDMTPDQLEELAERGPSIEMRDPFFASVIDALKPVVSRAKPSTVSVLVEGKPVALGTVVSEEGWILTKNEETLKGRLHVRVGDESFEAEVVERFPRRDLALLAIDADGLKPVRWVKEGKEKRLGSLLTSPSEQGEAMGIGLVSVKERVFADVGFLGIQTEQAEDGVRVVAVVPKSSAAKNGLKKGDVILELEGESVGDPLEFGNYVRGLRAGDVIDFLVARGGDELEFTVELGTRPEGPSSDRFRRMNEMAGPLSSKSSGYPSALQHDMPLLPEQCGGPVLNLRGECVAINVSRAGRVKTLAIPAADVLELLERVEVEEGPDREDLEAVRELIEEVQDNLSELQERLEELEAR